MSKAILFGAALLALAPAPPAAAQAGTYTMGPAVRHHPRMPVVTVGNGLVGSDRRHVPGADCRGPGGRDCFGGPTLRGSLWGYGGGLIEDPEASRDDGFFAGPAQVETSNGGAYFAYDRGYPYDWYNDGYQSAPAGAERLADAAPLVRCEVRWFVDTRGERSPVRICRGRR